MVLADVWIQICSANSQVAAFGGSSYRKEATIVQSWPYNAVLTGVFCWVITKPYLGSSYRIAKITIVVIISDIDCVQCRALAKINQKFFISS